MNDTTDKSWNILEASGPSYVHVMGLVEHIVMGLVEHIVVPLTKI